ncbi:hypothetical protein JYT44_01745 [Caldithrix abyssi]|nr:hypothetical protein [Caldithrix abyssi]
MKKKIAIILIVLGSILLFGFLAHKEAHKENLFSCSSCSEGKELENVKSIERKETLMFESKSLQISGSQKNLMVCKLTGPELQRRKQELQTEIFRELKNIRELEDGYAFEFENKDGLELSVADYLLAERKCCPFFKINYIMHPYDEGLEFHLTGSPEVKTSLLSLIKGMNLKVSINTTKVPG